MNTQFIPRFISAALAPLAATEKLAAYFAAVTDAELRLFDPSQLSNSERALWTAEVEKRSKRCRQDGRKA